MANVTKQALLDDLKADAMTVAETVNSLTPEQLEEGRYEGGWTARQILAHIAAIEWTYPRLLKLAGQPAPTGGEQRSARATEGGMDGYNARQVAKRADTSVADLVAEFQTNRAATIAAIESAEDAVLDTRIRSTGGRTGAVAQVLNDVAVAHVRQHLADLKGE
jgi:uncharacterized damage-inducible protein DinB